MVAIFNIMLYPVCDAIGYTRQRDARIDAYEAFYNVVIKDIELKKKLCGLGT